MPKRSSRGKESGVKANGASEPRPRGLSRHLEGWQPWSLAILLAGSSAILAVPRSVDPVELPVPIIAPAALEAAHRADDALAARAEAESKRRVPLDFDVRTLGSAVRAYGLADASGRDAEVVIARRDLTEAARRARAHGDEPLLKLRAYQLHLFLRALRIWDATGDEPADLRELGGGFAAMARQNGWIARGRLLVDEAARRALFKKRWSEITMLSGAKGSAFDLAVDEQRALHRFLLAHPPRDEADAGGGMRPPRGLGKDERAAFLVEQYRLRKIEELARIDPAYPADFARGVVLYRVRRYGAAIELFRRHLDAHPDGPLTLRAQNHLRSALERSAADEG